MRGYDTWKTGCPDDTPKQTIHEKLCDGTILIGYGRAGHGMNGKDADLDSCGQCLVKQLVTVDPLHADKMRIDIHLHLYANVCEPYVEQKDGETEEAYETRREKLMEVATEIVCGEVRYNGEWTGSDYWCFKTDAVLSVPLSVQEYEWIESGHDKILKRVANRICKAIYKGNDETRTFEKSMKYMNKAIDSLSKDGNIEA